MRLDRSGALPDRCIVCNADAGGRRLSRKLYWSPVAWRVFALATPFTLAGLGIATETPILIVLFWPLVLVLLFVHTFVRKKVEIELGICLRHRRLQAALGGVSIACLVAVFAAAPLMGENHELGLALLWSSIAGLICLSVAQSYLGVQAISVNKLTDEHAWLARTGKAFRGALPELPG